MTAPAITPSNFANNNEFYFYPAYAWRAADFQNMQTWTYSTIASLAAGAFGASVLNGYNVTTNTGMILNVAPGIAFNVLGTSMVLGAGTTVSVATPAGNAAWSLIVARPITTDTNFITNPTNPTGSTLPLSTILGVSIVCLDGTPSASPAYPTPLSTDVVLMGLKIPSGTTTLTTGMFDATQAYSRSADIFPLTAPDGTVGAPSYTFLSDPTTGVYKGGSGALDFSVTNNQVLHLTAGSIGALVPYISPLGSVGAPTYSFSGRTDIGMYSSGAHLIDFASNGVDVLQLGSTFVGPLVQTLAPLGSAGTPSYSFSGRATVGLYSPGANQVGIATNGLLALLLDASQNATVTGTIAASNLTGTNTGDQTSVSGNAGTATALQTARTINGTSFNGTANITVTAAAGTLTGATLAAGVTASSLTSLGTITSLVATDAAFTPTSSVNVTQGSAGTSFTNASTPVTLVNNNATANNWVALAFSDNGSNLAALMACQFIDRTNHYGALGFGVRSTFGFLQQLSVTGNGVTLGNSSTSLTSVNGNLGIQTAGQGFTVKEGSNAKQGVATLAAGTVTVSNTSVTANSRIFLTVQSLGTVAVATPIAVTARSAGTSFTISSSSITDTSVIAYELFEPS